MDFFAQQDQARRQTGVLVFYFALAVIATILLVYFVPVLSWYFYRSYSTETSSVAFRWWNANLFVGISLTTLMVVICGAVFKISQLRNGGGSGVATMLGGRQIQPDADDFFERRLLNVVEEMAIASGVPVPPVFLMEREKGINAFAAGFSPADSVVAVTYGTMTGLTREELQGVVAHEFSHILNRDMQINIKLMGFIHGLLIIGLTGRVILEFAAHSTRRRSSKNDSGQIVAFAFAAGIILWIVGSCGFFFTQLIKAAISRSRERLADASAVQFTRNPPGLASALKKIGGLAAGSRICSPKAAEASHMFFGNGMGRSIFHTHPPLPDRVRWLEPNFDGDFPRVTLEDLQQQLSRFEGAPKVEKEKQPDIVDLFTDPVGLATAATVLGAATAPPPAPPLRINEPEKLLETIGAPMEHHAEKAKELIAAIPAELKKLARDPYGVRALVYLLLLDSDQTIKAKQLERLRTEAEAGVYEVIKKTIDLQIELAPELYLPILDLSIPALRFLSASQYDAFRENIKALTDADDQISIFEFALQRVLMHSLDPVFGKRKKQPVNYYAIRGLEKEASTILSVLARIGQDSPEDAEAAFRAAAESIVAPNATFVLCPETQCNWKTFNSALNKMNEGSFKVKKWVLAASLVCLMHDSQITIEEVELFRAIADSLDCPVPPWVTVGKVSVG